MAAIQRNIETKDFNLLKQSVPFRLCINRRPVRCSIDFDRHFNNPQDVLLSRTILDIEATETINPVDQTNNFEILFTYIQSGQNTLTGNIIYKKRLEHLFDEMMDPLGGRYGAVPIHFFSIVNTNGGMQHIRPYFPDRMGFPSYAVSLLPAPRVDNTYLFSFNESSKDVCSSILDTTPMDTNISFMIRDYCATLLSN